MAVVASARARAHRALVGVTCDAADAGELLTGVLGSLRLAVDFDGGYLTATDPFTTLFASAVVTDQLPAASCAPIMDNEFLVDDFNKFADLHRNRIGPSTLHQATFDRPGRSSRFTEINQAYGFGSELRATFSTGASCWGVVNLLRESSAPDFATGDLEFVDQVSPLVATGLRRVIRHSNQQHRDSDSLAGVITLDRDGRVETLTDRAASLLEELTMQPVSSRGVSLPGDAYIVGSRARARAMGVAGPEPVARVHSRTGGWITLRGDCQRGIDGEIASTVVIIERSRPSEVLPLVVAAHGLSDREEEVLAELVAGRGTGEIADRLFISAHTVRDHVKSILEKTDTGSRGELVSRLFDLHYKPLMHQIHL